MARIKLNPNLPNDFVELDWNDAVGDKAAFCHNLVREYENGRTIILRNSPITADYELLNRISLPAGLKYKKMSDHLFENPILHPRTWGLHAHLLKDHPRDYRAACREILRASDAVRAWTKDVFHQYRFIKMPVSWRFTPTGNEHIHIDSFGARNDEPEKWYVRIFLNVDFEPRIWQVSHRLDALAQSRYVSAGMEQWRDDRGADFSREMSKIVFGTKANPIHGTEPFHEIAWETGDVWLVDSRLQSHQVDYGRRLMATGFEVEAASMQDPKKSLDHRVRAYHAAYGSSTSPAALQAEVERGASATT